MAEAAAAEAAQHPATALQRCMCVQKDTECFQVSEPIASWLH